MKKYSEIIFDLDGTLWDSVEGTYSAWVEVFKKRGLSVSDFTQQKIAGYMGWEMDAIGRDLFPELSEQEQLSIISDCGASEVSYLNEHGGTLYEGVEDTLKKLSEQYRLFIVSNSEDGYIQAFLHAHKLEQYITDIEMSYKYGITKGEAMKLLINRNYITHAVCVGDSEFDEEAAKYCGIDFIYASYGFGKAKHPKATLDAFNKLPDLLTHI